MNRILSQDEIDALVTAVGQTGDRGAAEAEPAVPYNFRRPDRVAKDQLRAVRGVHDRWARAFATSLSAYLRVPTDITVVSVEQFSYAECLSSCANPTAFYALSLAPLDEAGALDITPAVAFALVDKLLGGAGQPVVPSRAMTEIELNVLDPIATIWLDSLTEAWKPTVDMTFAIRGRETEPALLSIAAPDAAFVVIAFDVHIGEAQGLVSLCLPAGLVESGRGAAGAAWRRQPPAISPVERGWIHENLGRVVVPVSPFLETRISGRDVLALEPGDVISLGVSAADPVEVRVGGVRKLRGRLAATDRRAMVQVVSGPTANG
jgi:flagellar motor switch protein FliM